MESNFKAVEYRLHENLVRTQEMISLLGFDDALNQRITECKELIKTRKYVLAVMGEFKRGKSSLINALLGARILPADVTPTTATTNRITYGEKPEVQIHFHDGKDERVEMDQLSDYVAKITPEGANMARLIREAVVSYPTVICQNFVDIIDTPGLDDDAEMTRITISMIKHADAVIVPISARSPFSETERRFVCDLLERENISSLIFVVTFIDQLDEDDYTYDSFMRFVKNRILTDVFAELEKRGCSSDVQQKAHRVLEGIEVHGISSVLALESFLTNDPKKREKSHFEVFYRYLLRSVTSGQVTNTAQKVYRELYSVVHQFEEQNMRRMQEWEAQRVRLIESRTTFNALGGRLRKVLDVRFLNLEDVLQDKIQRVGGYKNFMRKEFITSLSSIRVNTHQEIFSILNEAQKRICAGADAFFQLELAQLRSALFALLPFYGADAQSKLQRSFPQLASKREAFFLPLEDSMREYAQQTLSGLAFKWEKFPIKQTGDLSQCNVIETINDAVTVSINELNRQLGISIVEIRKNWFSQVKEFAENVNSVAQETIKEEETSRDMQFHAYVSNYRQLSGKSSDIIEQSEDLCRLGMV